MFKLTIITPNGIYLDKDVTSLTLKLLSGYRTILTGHTPLIGALDYAPMYTMTNSDKDIYSLSGGAINIKDDGSVVIITNAIESQKDIDIARAESAKKRAESRLNGPRDDVDIERAMLALKRSIARIKTYEMK